MCDVELAVTLAEYEPQRRIIYQVPPNNEYEPSTREGNAK